MSDEGLHEIQLKGKQLVFLFMAATVVSVVVFLCGVMVGRGLHAPLALDGAETAAEADPTSTPPVPAAGEAVPEGTPLSAQETLTYAERLEAPTPVSETLREAVAPASNVPEPASEPMPVREPAVRTVGTSMSEPAGKGYVVQVMAASTRADAEGLARRLGSKGYPSFVTIADGTTRNQFRVRVGKYNNFREAEAVAQRLKKEEQFNTWITR